MKPIKILDVGQCGFDGPRMARLWREALHAQVDSAASHDEALERVASNDYSLVLVNRILAADGSSGLKVIEDLLEANDAVPVMLVSDRPDAQKQAVELGAMPGFGKADLEDEATLERIASAARRTTA